MLAEADEATGAGERGSALPVKADSVGTFRLAGDRSAGGAGRTARRPIDFVLRDTVTGEQTVITRPSWGRPASG